MPASWPTASCDRSRSRRALRSERPSATRRGSLSGIGSGPCPTDHLHTSHDHGGKPHHSVVFRVWSELETPYGRGSSSSHASPSPLVVPSPIAATRGTRALRPFPRGRGARLLSPTV